ncbi:acyl-CoA ligase (AMP-forming), exosortase A system-associated [Micromonospora echinospora]|uniref:acyl-CoA ligase (AMP-forming), exosortase A system-associated n=1 Tax=Micromonospora echinospora TaxID=1877 RepID=UPI00379CFAE4
MPTRIHDLVADAATRRGDAPAVTAGHTTVTYAELWAQVARVGVGLRRLGLRGGDRVAIHLDKRPETVSAIFGTSAAGGVFVPVNHLLHGPQVGHILRDAGATTLVTTPRQFERLAPILADAAALRHVVLLGTTEPTARGHYRVTGWAALTAQPEPASPTAGGDEDPAAIIYTSGSTGKPKGVVLSHRNLVLGAQSVNRYLGNTGDDVIAALLPLSFDAGLSQLTTAFHVGAHVVLVNYLTAGEVVRVCARHQVTGMTSVPPQWIQLAEVDWPPEATRRIRYFANTGGRLPQATLTRLRERMPHAKPYLMYGLTEAFRSTYLDPAEVDRRPDSIGRAIPNAEVMVLRPDGTPCDDDEPGELVHCGPLVTMGYWNDPVATAERFRPAPGTDPQRPEYAVYSGDLVVRDREGFLYFVGRADDMIKTSGYRVSPTEVEEACYDTGLVRDVVALGVADDRLGQQIVVVVTPAATDAPFDPATLVARLRRSVPSYMLPQRVLLRPELPRGPNGKFDRARIRREVTT